MKRKKRFSDLALDLIKVYRENPILAAEDLLGIDLDAPQKVILEEMWFKSYTIVTAGRGCGKSYLLSVISALYALLYPGKKVLIMSPSFRQSKHCFDELKRRYIESPILREACVKKPIIGSDRCYLDFYGVEGKAGSNVSAFPLGDGSRIRGLRGHFILVDEFAQVPEDIFETVIRPMGATTMSPMENVRRLQMLKDKLEDGILSKDEYETERDGMQTNKIVGVTSAYYQFNHVYRRIQKYQEEIDKGSTKYGLCYISYEDMTEGFLDSNNIEEAKITMSRTEFNLEYRGIWESDSDGVFKASLIEGCKSRACPVRLKGEIGKKYIVGVDPARSSDAFAIVVIEIGDPSFIVHAFQVTGETFPKMSSIIYDFCSKFDSQLIMMDAGSGGGGVAIKDILSSEQFSKGHLILDMDDEDHRKLKGQRILRMHDPKPKSIADANFAALNLLEQGLLRFPLPPVDGHEERESVYSDIKEMTTQMMLITTTQTKSGLLHFDIPSTGKGKRKKDLYSAFILAAKGLYDTVVAREEETYFINQGGLIIPIDRVHSSPAISSISNYPGRS
ncbi:MAG: terminase family protein [Candidatus Peribacteraceae bacterium]|nr:terminase family protein [Candidatus Peribacteraceae bacterium]